MKSPKTIIILVLVVAGVGIGGVLGFQWMVSNSAQAAINEAELNVTSVQVLSVNSSNVSMQINGTIDNPSSYDATYQGDDIGIYVNSSSYGSFLLGRIDIPAQIAHPGQNSFSINVDMAVSDSSSLNKFIECFLLEPNLTITLVGSITINVEGLMMPVSTEVNLDKSTEFPALNGLKSIEIDSFMLTNVTSDFFTFAVNATVYNPSLITVDIESIDWNVTYKSSIVGNVHASNVRLSPGENEIYATGTLQVWNLSDGQELASRYISGENITVTLSGSVILKAGETEFEVKSNLQIPVNLTGQPEIQVHVKSINIYEINTTYIKVFAVFTLVNPSIISGNITGLKLDVLYENQVLGTVSIPSFYITHGENDIAVDTTFTPTNTAVITEIASQLLNGKNITVTVRGSESGNTLSVLLHGWYQDVTISSTSSFELHVTRIGLLNSTSDSVYLEFGLQIENPLNATLNVNNFVMQVYYTATGELLGNLTIDELTLAPGSNDISTVAKLSPENVNLVSTIVDDYLDGKNITLTLKGISTGHEETIVSAVIAGMEFNVTLPGVTPLDIVIISMEIINVTSTNVTMSVEISINNPTASPVSMDKIVFSVNYTNQHLGNITVNPLTVDPGRHIYDFNITFVPASTALLKQLITDYVNNKTIEVVVKGYPNGNDVLSKVIADYNTTIMIPPLDLQLQILGFALLNTTATTIEIGINVTMTNPLQIELELWNVTIGVYYNGIIIGNVTADALTLPPGESMVQLNGTLDKSVNETNVSLFLSNYITGHDIYLEMQGSFYTNVSGIIDDSEIPISLSYVLPAITQPLINKVILEEITVIVTLSNIGFTATASVYVNNPMNFEINITYLSYELYFDDKDGARVDLVLVVYQYSPKDHVYIDTVTQNLTTTPISLAANTTTTISQQVSSSDTELCVRLYDEYELKNQLKVDVINGVMYLQIGAFEVKVSFEFYDVPIPKS
ncbi:MAG: DUF3712 domain-containing protein [Candidatus Asgardarchaeia archaeon]